MTKKNAPDPAPQQNPAGYPLYPDNEDIYSRSHKETYPDTEDGAEQDTIAPSGRPETRNEKDFDDDLSGDDLDVPGAELDDLEENMGNEDEENNYYSLGGDNHNDLEEDQGD